MPHVVTCFLRHGGRVLIARRSDAVGTYRGLWAGVSGYVEGDPADALDDARRELREEVGVSDATLVRAGDPLEVVDGDREWTVHPFLFDAPDRDVDPNEELAAVEWVSPTAILDRETVPGLWDAYCRIAPTVETVREDATHGSAYISIRALEVLRDHAAVAEEWESVVAVARDLRGARPGMAAVATRVNRAMSAATDEDGTSASLRPRTPAAVHATPLDEIDAAAVADEGAAETAARVLADLDRPGCVATLSRSGTVLETLRRARPDVLVGESRPACEGVDVAETLARDGLAVTLATDAALPWVLAERAVKAVLVGADSILADGSVVNKAGTRALALVARNEGIPLYVVAARDKVRPDEVMHGETGSPTELYEGPAALDVANPLFDLTPADLVTGVATEEGVLDADDVREVAEVHRQLAGWDDRGA